MNKRNSLPFDSFGQFDKKASKSEEEKNPSDNHQFKRQKTEEFIPATQCSPPRPQLKNKLLSKVQGENRALISSPSILGSKSLAPVQDEKDPKGFDVNQLFNELKKDDEKKKIPVPEYVDLVSAGSQPKLEEFGAKSEANLSPVRKFKPNPDWDQINPEAIKILKENTKNFQEILAALKKANEKILEFKRALATSPNEKEVTTLKPFN